MNTQKIHIPIIGFNAYKKYDSDKQKLVFAVIPVQILFRLWCIVLTKETRRINDEASVIIKLKWMRRTPQ